MKARDYVHELYDKNITMDQIIDNYDEEIDGTIKNDIEQEFHNNFVLTSNENGVSRYESIFNIKPDKDNETLQERKEVILNRLTSHLPFTQAFLENKLNEIIGEGKWTLNIDYSTFEITINFTVPGDVWYNEIIDLFNKVIPCNMHWTVNLYNTTWNQVKEGFSTWNDVKSYTWSEILLGGWVS